MSTKRPRDEGAGAAEASSSAGAPEAKRPRHGFRVGPENLPDGPWRRKVTKIKKDLIHKAKVKKAFAKVKAAEEQEKTKKDVDEAGGASDGDEGEPEPQIHPERQAMLDEQEQRQQQRQQRQEEQGDQDADQEPQEHSHRDGARRQRGDRRDRRRPGYYDKALEQAEKRKQEAEARAAEAKRRAEERERKIAERERIRRAMAKARAGSRNGGQRKLGRESGVLLEKVKRMVSQ